MGVVNEAVEDGVGISWVADEGMPFVDRDLAGEDGRAAPVAFLEDLVEITTAAVEGFEAPIVENEELDAGETTQTSSVVVARSRNVGVEDWHAIGGRPLRNLAIELVVEDRTHRTVGRGADLDRPRRGGFETIGAERPHQPHDAKAGAESLLGVGLALQDQLAERGGSWTDRSGLAADADCGDDCQGSPGLLHLPEADQSDLPRVWPVAPGRAQGDSVRSDRVSLRAQPAAIAAD